MNQQPPTVPVEMVDAVGSCPLACQGPQKYLIQQMFEATPMRALVGIFCRCQHCLTGWRVDLDGKISSITVIESREVFVCPKCHLHFDQEAAMQLHKCGGGG